MFLLLLLSTLFAAFLVSFVVSRMFSMPIAGILKRLISEDIYTAWQRYIIFAIYVVGISSGVRIWKLEEYVSGRGPEHTPLELTSLRWVLEIYRAIIGTLQGIAWLLLLFFMVALIAYVIMKAFEARKTHRTE